MKLSFVMKGGKNIEIFGPRKLFSPLKVINTLTETKEFSLTFH